MNHQSRTKKIIHLLKKEYPDVKCELKYANPFQLLVAVILSAQATDKSVNKVTPALFQKFKTPKDFADADLPQLQAAIKTIGLYRNKAKNIKAMAATLLWSHDGKVPQTMAEMVALPGVGRKTANVVLGDAYGVREGICVDTHVARLSGRLGLTGNRDPVKIEKDLMKIVVKKEWSLFSHLLVWHGRRVCGARKPGCERCCLLDLCPFGRANN